MWPLTSGMTCRRSPSEDGIPCTAATGRPPHPTEGVLEGAQLEPYRYLDTFWFTWVTSRPDTEPVDLGAADK